ANFTNALNATCPSGTHLATLADVAENEAAMQAISGNGDDAWIALKATSSLGSYAWQAPSSEAFDSRRFHGFAGAEPNEPDTPNCVRLVDGAGWKDIDCANDYDALCERE
ncbi:MAG TPA: C-type lectin domain-containing protein, partial [Polyangia bacterium]